ncbi:putative MFS family arabinose efflux permease [Sporomusaceae bacterium BoRhaA]|uniref:MFS transporter n=1 Tax=Pelorhabdus rhamnosifermentans TaxID=2772457 RepID=UPI001C06293D|nr:MFS transporter [Pelorhabdus rhamnosifermentans]MBU2699681.1 putative MFS family arabinose efflux permease [Pelorhabdus rhamnosifermentans]
MVKLLAIFTNRQFQNIALSHFSTTLGMNLLIPILPVFLQSKGFAETQIGLIMGATAASALFIRPWVGVQVDTRGSRPLILVGQLLLMLSMIGFLWATNFLSFFMLRVLFGFALAFYGTGAVTFASSIGTGETNSNSIAMYTLTTMIGLGMSMSLAQVAFDTFGFLTLVSMGFVLIGLAFGVMRFRAHSVKMSGNSSQRVPFLVVLKARTVLATLFCQFGASFSFGAVFTFVPLAALDCGIQFYSLFFIAFAVSVIGSRFFVQQVNELFGLEKASVYAGVIMIVALVLLLVKISAIILVCAGLLFGLGFGIVFPSLVLILVQRISQTNRGTALGILIAAGDIGNACSTAILGGVAEHFGYFALFLTTAFILVLGVYGFYRIISKEFAVHSHVVAHS